MYIASAKIAAHLVSYSLFLGIEILKNYDVQKDFYSTDPLLSGSYITTTWAKVSLSTYLFSLHARSDYGMGNFQGYMDGNEAYSKVPPLGTTWA